MPRQPKPSLWALAQAWDASSNAVAKAMSTEQLASEAFARELEEADLGPEISMRQAFNILKAAFDPPKRQHRRKVPPMESPGDQATDFQPDVWEVEHQHAAMLPPAERVASKRATRQAAAPPRPPTLIGPFDDWEQAQWLDGFRVGDTVQLWAMPDPPQGIVQSIVGDKLEVRLDNGIGEFIYQYPSQLIRIATRTGQTVGPINEPLKEVQP